MGMLYRIVILVALVALWGLFYLAIPVARDRELWRYHILAICGLIIFYLAIIDPIHLADFFFRMRDCLGAK